MIKHLFSIDQKETDLGIEFSLDTVDGDEGPKYFGEKIVPIYLTRCQRLKMIFAKYLCCCMKKSELKKVVE